MRCNLKGNYHASPSFLDIFDVQRLGRARALAGDLREAAAVSSTVQNALLGFWLYCAAKGLQLIFAASAIATDSIWQLIERGLA